MNKNKPMMIAGGVLGVILIGLAIYFSLNRTVEIDNVPEDAATRQATSSQPTTYLWNFVESEADDTGLTHTTVSVEVRGKIYALGMYGGNCFEVKAGTAGVLGEMSDSDEVSRAQCWFAGSGDELGVFEVGQKVIIKAGELGEGSAEEAPFRGNFKTLFEI